MQGWNPGKPRRSTGGNPGVRGNGHVRSQETRITRSSRDRASRSLTPAPFGRLGDGASGDERGIAFSGRGVGRERMTKGRLEAFSDGVMAIAITLLTLDLPVPTPENTDGPWHGLWSALGHDWPKLAAYVVSFAIIGIIWVNHHGLMNRVAVIDRTLLFINLLLLLVVAAIPWSTSLFAEFLLEGGTDAHVAAAVFSAN